jgi:hypothetical protein
VVFFSGASFGQELPGSRCIANSWYRSTGLVQPSVTTGADRNQVQIVIGVLTASEVLVMDLKILSGATNLTAPAIALKDMQP